MENSKVMDENTMIIKKVTTNFERSLVVHKSTSFGLNETFIIFTSIAWNGSSSLYLGCVNVECIQQKSLQFDW